MKNITIHIKFVLVSLVLVFSLSVFAAPEIETINVKLSSRIFEGTFTETVKKDYNVDHILYIEEEETISKNYISYKDRVPSLLYLYHRNQDSSLVGSGDIFNFRCSNGILWVDDYRFNDVWLNFKIENKNFFLKIKCSLDNETRTEQPGKMFDFKEKDVYINNELQPYSISSQYGDIELENIENSFLKPNPSIQPTFVDILYLQIQTIDHIIASLNVLGVDTQDLFEDPQELAFYNQWLDIYFLYTNKKVFVDSFQHSASIKDIGIANDITKGLSKRLLCEYKGGTTCSNIKVQFSKKGKYEFYTLEGIIDGVFSENKTADIMVSLYSETKKLVGGFDDIGNPWVKSLIDSFMEKTYGIVDDIGNLSDYGIGYALQTRIDNIILLKDEINSITDEKMNILGIYNFYFEINNVMKGQSKVIKINENRDSDELKEFIENIIIKQNIKEKGDILGDESEIFIQDIAYKLQNDILTIFNLKEKDVIFEFICGNVEGATIIDYLNMENINTYEDYYNVLGGLIGVAYNEMNIRTQGGNELYALSFNMSHMKNTAYEEYFVINNDCIYVSDDPLLALWYNLESVIYNTENITYITDRSNKNNIGYRSLYPLSEMPVITGNSIYFNGNSSLKIFDSQDINIGNFDKRTIEIDFTTYDKTKTQVLYDEGNHILGVNIFIKDSKLTIGAWNYYADWEGTFLSVDIEENVAYRVKLVLDTDINGASDGFRMYLDTGSGYIKKGQGLAYPLEPHYLTRIGCNTRTKYALNCEEEEDYCVWNREDDNYFYGEIRDIKIWNAIR